jgi:hypothetical protein
MAEHLSFLRRWFSPGARLGEKSAPRETLFAAAVFAAIVAFAALSLNYLISGGPDWNPGAPSVHAGSPARARPAALSRRDIVEPPPPLPTPRPVDMVEFFDIPGPPGPLLGEPGQNAAVEAPENDFEQQEFNRAVDQLAAQNGDPPPKPKMDQGIY